MGDDQERLAKLFARLGARDPEDWARSQLDEGVNQLDRFLFLRAAWRAVNREGDTAWIDTTMRAADKHPSAPGAGAGAALRRLLAAGADPRDIAEVARVQQWQTLQGLCYLLEDPGELETEVSERAWGLFAIDDAGQPGQPITGLHESVLETEPSGREMRPRS